MDATKPASTGPARLVPGRVAALLPMAGIVLVALNLRAALTSVGPVIGDVRDDLGLSGATVGLLTAAPLLALGLVAPLAPRLARRAGAERVLVGCLLAIGAGLVVRVLPALALLFLGTLVAGCAIAIGNVLLPSLVKHRFPARAASMTGVYALALGVGGTVGAGLTVPVQQWAGGSWRIALGVWALPALLAALVWLPQLRGATSFDRAEGHDGVPPRLWRDRVAWSVTGVMAAQSLLFYTTAAWLPEIYRHEGVGSAAAGGLLSVLMVVSLGGSFLAAVALARLGDQRPVAVATVGLTAAGFAGVLLSPLSPAPLWPTLLGLGMGGSFTLALTLLVVRAPDARHAAELSGMAQSAGYTIAAVGPIAIGATHDVTGGWTVPLLVLLALTVPELLVALAASRPRLVGE